jgi:predicted site-specific integrase-resolvase
MTFQPWLTRKQAAQELQVTTATIDTWLKAGHLSGSQIVPNGTVRISAASVERMLIRSKIKTTKMNQGR